MAVDWTDPDGWRAEAACLGADSSLWFPSRGETAMAAKVICFTCPVMVECGEAGLYQPMGVWGGMSERERRNARRDRLRAERGL